MSSLASIFKSIWSLAAAFINWVRITEVNPPEKKNQTSSPIQYDDDVTEIYLA